MVDIGDAAAPTLEDLADHVRQRWPATRRRASWCVAPIHRAANGKLDYKAVRAEALKALGVEA